MSYPPVPEKIIRFAEDLPYERIACNLRQWQRPNPSEPLKPPFERLRLACIGDCLWVDQQFYRFLSQVPITLGPPRRKPWKRVVIHFRWHAPEIYTAIADLESVFYDVSHYPRLDFTQMMEVLRGESVASDRAFFGDSIWGAFFLAIARLDRPSELLCQEDPEGDLFLQIIS